MGIKDRFFGNSKKKSDKTENPPTTDIQPSDTSSSPEPETSGANKGFLQQIRNKFRKKSKDHEQQKVESAKDALVDIKPINQEVETETNKEIKQKNRLQSIIQNVLKKDSDVPQSSPTETSIDEVKPQVNPQATNTNPNKLKQIFNQLTKKELEVIQTEQAIEKIDEKLKNTSNSNKIKDIFHKLVQSANPQDIQKIKEKLPQMNRGPIKEIWPKIQSLFQMVLDPKAAWTSKALAIASLVYLVSPFDAIPDIIPIVGLTDDAALIISVFSALAFELTRYAKQSAEKGIEMAEQLADIEVRKYNRIVRITLTGSIIAAILAIAVKLILKYI